MGNIHVTITTLAGRFLLAIAVALLASPVMTALTAWRDEQTFATLSLYWLAAFALLSVGTYAALAVINRYILSQNSTRISEMLAELREAGFLLQRLTYFAELWSGHSMTELKANIKFKLLKKACGDSVIPVVRYERAVDPTSSTGFTDVAVIHIDEFARYLRVRGEL